MVHLPVHEREETHVRGEKEIDTVVSFRILDVPARRPPIVCTVPTYALTAHLLSEVNPAPSIAMTSYYMFSFHATNVDPIHMIGTGACDFDPHPNSDGHRPQL